MVVNVVSDVSAHKHTHTHTHTSTHLCQNCSRFKRCLFLYIGIQQQVTHNMTPDVLMVIYNYIYIISHLTIHFLFYGTFTFMYSYNIYIYICINIGNGYIIVKDSFMDSLSLSISSHSDGLLMAFCHNIYI